jgi:hypothetical protein
MEYLGTRHGISQTPQIILHLTTHLFFTDWSDLNRAIAITPDFSQLSKDNSNQITKEL